MYYEVPIFNFGLFIVLFRPAGADVCRVVLEEQK